MSLAYKPMQPIIVQDPLLSVDDVSQCAVIQGASQITYQQISTTSISNNNLAYAVVPPQGIIVSRRMRHQVPIRLTLTGRAITTNAGLVTATKLVNSGFDAPRQFPLMTMTNSITMQLNNDTFQTNCGDSFSGLARYNTSRDVQCRENSTTAAYPDQSARFQDLIGTARNPLGNFGNSSADIQRGAFPFAVVTAVAVVPAVGAGTAATAIIDMVVTEDVMISPAFFLSSVQQNAQGFFGLNNINMSFNFFQGLGGKYWSHSPAPVITSGADTITTVVDSIAIQFNNFTGPAFSFSNSLPTLQLEYLTPNILQKPQLSIANAYNYAYYDVNQQNTNFGLIPYSATGTTQKSINSITLSQIPTAVYLMVKPKSQTLQNNCQLTDSFLQIVNVNIQFNNQSGILSTASQVQLYDIAIKNGLQNCSWAQFSGLPIQSSVLGTTYCGGGAPLKLVFGEDIYLAANESAGMANSNYQFSCTLTIANRDSSLSLDAVDMDCYAVFVTAGSMTIANSNVSHQVAVISASDVLNANEQPSLNMRNFRNDQSIIGGNFMDTLGNWGNKINDFLKQSKIISTVGKILPLPYASQVGQVADVLGYGQGGYNVGGAHMGKQQLRKSLMYR